MLCFRNSFVLCGFLLVLGDSVKAREILVHVSGQISLDAKKIKWLLLHRIPLYLLRLNSKDSTNSERIPRSFSF